MKSLRSAGSLHRGARLRQEFVLALEVGLVGQDREAGRAAALVGAGQRRRIEVRPDQALAGRGLLDLGDQAVAAGRDGGLQRLGEAARRLGGLRASSRTRPGNAAPCSAATCWRLSSTILVSVSLMRRSSPGFRAPCGPCRCRSRRRPSRRPASGPAALPATIRRGGAVQHHDIAEGVALSRQHGADRVGIVRRIAALERGERRTLHADVFRGDLDLGHLAVARARRPSSWSWW